jgi:3-dehydroquinate synthetase
MHSFPYPQTIPEKYMPHILETLHLDKKARRGAARFVCLKEIGEAVQSPSFCEEFSLDLIQVCFSSFLRSK